MEPRLALVKPVRPHFEFCHKAMGGHLATTTRADLSNGRPLVFLGEMPTEEALRETVRVKLPPPSGSRKPGQSRCADAENN
jgi:hypothetical protein